MYFVFNLNGSILFLDVFIVAPFFRDPSLVFAASTKQGLIAKKEKKPNANVTGTHTSMWSRSF